MSGSEPNSAASIFVQVLVYSGLAYVFVRPAFERWRFVRTVKRLGDTLGLGSADLLAGEGWDKYAVVANGVATMQESAAGNAERAMAIAAALMEAAERSTAQTPWYFVNLATCAFVNGGRYTLAVDLPGRWSEEAQERGRQAEPVQYVLTQINRAEALHNLGRDEIALELLASVEDQSGRDPLARNGLLTLRAWILAHLGQGAAAREAIDKVDPEALPAYAAEYHYTLASVARANQELSLARREAEAGLREAVFASSKRNGLVMLGAIAAAAGEDDEAMARLEAASSDAYKGQAAPGLVALARVQLKRGQHHDASRTLRLAVKYDEESYACVQARALLSEVAGSTAEP